MKNLFLCVLIFCLNFGVSVAQEFKVDYKIQYKYTHHSNLASLKSNKTESLYLFTGEGKSIFTNYNVAHQEEIEKNRMKMASIGKSDLEDWGARFSYFNEEYYKDYALEEVWILPQLEGYIYAELRVPLEWDILEQTKEFMGFSAQAATTDFAGRSYTAWFTTEIPIPDGPHVFFGLPGLVVDVYDSEEHFRFQLEGIEKVEVESFRKLPESKKILRSEYSKIYSNHKSMVDLTQLEAVRKGLVQYEDAYGNTVPFTELEFLSVKREREKQNKKNYNPMDLELDPIR